MFLIFYLFLSAYFFLFHFPVCVIYDIPDNTIVRTKFPHVFAVYLHESLIALSRGDADFLISMKVCTDQAAGHHL